MRHFYIFNISNEFIILTKTHPYTLFKTFEELYYMPKKDINYGANIYDNITTPIEKINLNKEIFNDYKLDDHYTKFMNTHLYNNYFSDENTKLTINNSFIKLDTTSINPVFFKFLNKYNHLFVCDFENKDYFWLESIA